MFFVLAVNLCSPLSGVCYWDLRDQYPTEERCVLAGLAAQLNENPRPAGWNCLRTRIPMPKARPTHGERMRNPTPRS